MKKLSIRLIFLFTVLLLMITGLDLSVFAASEIPLTERIERLEKIIQDQQRMIQDQQRMIRAIKLELEQKETMPVEAAVGPIPKGDSQVGPLDDYNVRIEFPYVNRDKCLL